jgi:hypothetical protein
MYVQNIKGVIKAIFSRRQRSWEAREKDSSPSHKSSFRVACVFYCSTVGIQTSRKFEGDVYEYSFCHFFAEIKTELAARNENVSLRGHYRFDTPPPPAGRRIEKE